MNIFVLDHRPQVAVRMLCDKHVVKMCLETAQILSTAVKAFDKRNDLYKAGFKHHPCCIWAGESRTNFEWLCHYGLWICREYTYRYGKQHKSEAIIRLAEDFGHELPDIGFTAFAQAMPDQYKSPSAVKAYRQYYIGEKLGFAKWTKRPTPYWINK